MYTFPYNSGLKAQTKEIILSHVWILHRQLPNVCKEVSNHKSDANVFLQ